MLRNIELYPFLILMGMGRRKISIGRGDDGAGRRIWKLTMKSLRADDDPVG